MRKTLTIALSLWLYQFAVCADLDAWNNGTNATIRVGQATAIALTLTNTASGTNAVIVSDAANTAAIRNGANAGSFRIYGTYTDASNYERLNLAMSATTSDILASSAGTGIARPLRFGANNTAAWQITTNGHLNAVTDNTYDIGANGANRPKNVYVAGSGTFSGGVTVTSGELVTSGSGIRLGNGAIGYLQSASDGVFSFKNNAGTDFGRLQFGGATASYPSLKRSSAGLITRLADDSADTTHQASQFVISGTTNQVIFGGTNTAPVSSVAPTKWISVQVTGESTVYRLPLYE